MAQQDAKLLLLEGKSSSNPLFFSGLTRKGFNVELVQNGSSALKWLNQNTPDIVLINAVSLRTSGARICKSIKREFPLIPLLLIVENAEQKQDAPEVDVVIALPFTLQKLLNRIRILLPAEEKNLIRVGPISLDVENRWVRCEDRQSRLTPRLVTLLKELMDKPGEIYDREELFRLVWDTAYTGDTRTLDVHISWLRQAVEVDPRKPKYIKTIRGIGYRLETDSFES